jgi:hypothetical protein
LLLWHQVLVKVLAQHECPQHQQEYGNGFHMLIHMATITPKPMTPAAINT